MGAWIEICNPRAMRFSVDVAPFVGAWIEMPKDAAKDCPRPSHPSWVRGLKYADSLFLGFLLWSHPSWVRGLKSVLGALTKLVECRTLRGCVD